MKICIDAGHNYSGADAGAVGNGLREQDVTFAIASFLRTFLADRGIEVMMLRNKITDNVGNTSLIDSLNARSDGANKWGADLFVSIHTNSSTFSSAKGTETHIVAKGGEAEKLAEKVNNNIVKMIGTTDRGVKVSNFSVLRKTKMPAILIETAFISNQSDAQLLRNRQIDFASAIYGGICEYLEIPLATACKTSEEIIDKIAGMVEITDKPRAIAHLERAKKENSSLYWILKKIAQKGAIK